MKHADALDPCTLARDRIDAYLDGDLAPEEAARFEAHCASCADCADELALARSIDSAFRALPARPCPDRVTDAVFARVRAERRAARLKRVRNWADAWLRPAWAPAAALAAVLVLTLTVVLTRPEPAPPEPAYTTAEVDQAVADVQWTLAFLSDVGQRTGRIVRDDVLEPHVVGTVRRTVDDAVSGR